MAHGQGGAEIGFDRGPTLTCNHEAPIAAYGIRTANTSSNGWGIQEEVTHTLRGEGFDASEDGTGRGTPLVPVAFVQNSRNEVRLMGGDGSIVGALAAETGAKQQCYVASPVAFSAKDYGGDAMVDLSPTLRAGGHSTSHANAGVMPAIAFPANLSGTQHASTEELAPALGAVNPTAVAQPVGIFQDSEFGVAQYDSAGTLRAGRIHEHQMVMQPAIALQTDVTPKASVELAFTLKLPSSTGGGQPAAAMTPAMQVRRLTPRECERLQGFPDDYTLIPWKAHQAWAKKKGTHADGKSFEEWLIENTGRGLRQPTTQDCPDGPRYKALGNSWAVPVVRWIGSRIDAALREVPA